MQNTFQNLDTLIFTKKKNNKLQPIKYTKYKYFDIMQKKNYILHNEVNLLNATLYKMFANDNDIIQWLTRYNEVSCKKCKAEHNNLIFKKKPTDTFNTLSKSHYCFLECKKCGSTQSPTHGTIFAKLKSQNPNPILQKVIALTYYIYGMFLLQFKLCKIYMTAKKPYKTIRNTIWSVSEYAIITGYTEKTAKKLLDDFKRLLSKSGKDKYLMKLVNTIKYYLHYFLVSEML